VWRAIYRHSCPAVCDNFDVRSGQVRVCFDEMSAENAAKELGRGDGVLLRLDVDGVLHRVCSNNHAVVCLGVSADKWLIPRIQGD
jgi:hypothetical protein